MKITIIDGASLDYKHQNYTNDLALELASQGHIVNLIKASQKKINFCNGCWSCWWATPGKCPQKDDMPEIYTSYLKSDLVLHLSPLKMGFISAKLKTINDRSIPLVHPYITLVNGECHHVKRYDTYPGFGLIVDDENCDSEDIKITQDLYNRMALNLKSELKLFTTTHQSMEDICNELNNI